MPDNLGEILGALVAAGGVLWAVVQFAFKAGGRNTKVDSSVDKMTTAVTNLDNNMKTGFQTVHEKIDVLRDNTNTELEQVRRSITALDDDVAEERKVRREDVRGLHEKMDRSIQKQDVAHAYQRSHSERKIPKVD